MMRQRARLENGKKSNSDESPTWQCDLFWPAVWADSCRFCRWNYLDKKNPCTSAQFHQLPLKARVRLLKVRHQSTGGGE